MSVRPSADVAIVTVLADCELRAALHAFGLADDAKPDAVEEGTRYWWTEVESAALGRTLSVVITVIGEAGTADASAATATLISDYRPTLVCLVGIAAGVAEKVSLGDVVIGRYVIGYEREKLLPDRHEGTPVYKEPPYAVRGDSTTFIDSASTRLLNERIANHLTLLSAEVLPPEDVLPSTHKVDPLASIASGDKIFGDGSLADLATLYHNRKLIAGEMEGIGFAVAADRAGCLWLVFRGISDYGDPLSKDGRYKDKFHHVASASSAETCRLFLERQYSGGGVQATALPASPFRRAPDLSIRRVLISASDKTGLETLLDYFSTSGVELVATNNSANALRAMGYEVRDVFDFVGCEPLTEMRGTLHPYVLAAIATSSSDVDRLSELEAYGLGSIDLIIVNTREVRVSDEASVDELMTLLGSVQTGGPSLLRWAIKEWAACAALVSSSDYGVVLRDLQSRGGRLSPETRARLFSRALQYVAAKDAETGRLLNALWPSELT